MACTCIENNDKSRGAEQLIAWCVRTIINKGGDYKALHIQTTQLRVHIHHIIESGDIKSFTRERQKYTSIDDIQKDYHTYECNRTKSQLSNDELEDKCLHATGFLVIYNHINGLG